MHALRSSRNFLAGLGLAAFLVGLMPGLATAAPSNPFAKTNYKLFARALSYINVNRVYMGINTIGNVGIDSGGATNRVGGFWPRGSNDGYVFNSGLQVIGVVDGVKSPSNPWGGDTAGGWFFDGSGGRTETEGVTPAYQSFNAADAANWPADAFVPLGDEVAELYAEPLRGLPAASQGDVHFLSWDGNPALNIGRLHPIGVLVDYRVLAWNYPAGAQDIVFLVATVYNVTSANCGDYAQHRAGIRQILCDQGVKFQSLNNAKFGVQLPVGGYSIRDAFIGVGGDNDVGVAGSNYNGLILPFAMGYTYEGPFGSNAPGWKFDPAIFGPPFFVGVGFVGYKYLKGPDGPGEIQLFSSYCNGGPCGTGHNDPGSLIINYRALAGTPAATDGQCNITAPGKSPADLHVCYMLLGAAGTDIRMLESSKPLSLAPGGAKSVVIAYVYAAPVQVPGFTPTTTQHDPGNVTWSNSTDSMFKYNQSGSPGLNLVDSISGFRGYIGPHFNGDGTVHQPVQDDFAVVKGSLLGKALVAQAVFNAKFLQEFAPDAPPFFLIPGDKQVTILWKPSPTETVGDPYFAIVSPPTIVSNGLTIANPLYDPNYRQFDVEGYRIYRGRSDSPNALKLLVQFDYAGTKIKDFTGFVAIGNCAPELGILTDCPATTPAGGFPTPANPIPPLTAATRSVSYNIGPQSDLSPLRFIDQTDGSRKALNGNTTTIATIVDTVVSGGTEGNLPLADNGVPFIFIDKAGAPGCTICGVANGVAYYYAVTAFDVNAPGHGPTSLESARVAKQVIPQAAAGNFSNANSTKSGIFGRSGLLTDNVLPTVDPTTGAYSKKFPPSNAVSLSLAGFAPQLLKGTGSVGIQYDSTQLTALASAGNATVTDWFTSLASSGTTKISIPFVIPFTTGTVSANGSFTALAVDSALAAPFGGGAGYTIAASFSVTRIGSYWTGTQGRGCANAVYGVSPARPGQCYFSTPRWFSGATEGPNQGVVSPISIDNDAGGAGLPGVNYGNGGTLAGVTTVHFPYAASYLINAPRRDVDNAMSPFVTAADYKLYWGAAGVIDSVIDVTHDEPVPFSTRVGASWGVLNEQATAGGDGRVDVTADDISCVPPLRTISVANPSPACTSTFALENTARPGKVAFFNGALANAQSSTLAPTAAGAGFMLYLKGRTYIFELTGGALPAAGTVWTCRDYVGILYGGKGTYVPPGGAARDAGAYAFIAAPFRPFTAPGAAAKFSYEVANELIAVDKNIVAKVHTVPDPYYVTSAYDIAVNNKNIEFVNVPTGATIRIYSSSGVLLRVLQNKTTQFGGIVNWDVRNRTNQFVASGVYFYTVEAAGISSSGRMTIVNYASTVQ